MELKEIQRNSCKTVGHQKITEKNRTNQQVGPWCFGTSGKSMVLGILWSYLEFFISFWYNRRLLTQKGTEKSMSPHVF